MYFILYRIKKKKAIIFPYLWRLQGKFAYVLTKENDGHCIGCKN